MNTWWMWNYSHNNNMVEAAAAATAAGKLLTKMNSEGCAMWDWATRREWEIEQAREGVEGLDGKVRERMSMVLRTTKHPLFQTAFLSSLWSMWFFHDFIFRYKFVNWWMNRWRVIALAIYMSLLSLSFMHLTVRKIVFRKISKDRNSQRPKRSKC